MQKFQDVLDGKLKVTDLTPEEMPDFVKFGQAESAKVLTEVGGVRGARQAEEDKLKDLGTKVAEAQGIITKAEELSKPALSPEMQSFRAEQVEKAKLRLFSTVKLTDEEKVEVLEKFKALDSNKMDADFIYKDLLSAVAATKPDQFLEMSQQRTQAEQDAAAELLRQSGGGDGAPTGEDGKKKFSDEALKLAKDAGITPEAAHKQITQGMSRVHG